MKKLVLLLFIPFVCLGQTANEYFATGTEKMNGNDYYRAISNFSKAIELWESEALKKEIEVNKLLDGWEATIKLADGWDYDYYTFCYLWNGELKQKINDHKGAITDLDRYIQLLIWDNDERAYLLRGISKHALEDYYGAIADFNKSIELKADYAEAYRYRGYAKRKLGDNKGAKEDVRKSKLIIIIDDIKDDINPK